MAQLLCLPQQFYKVSMRKRQYSNEFSHTMMRSRREAIRLGSTSIGTGHLLLGLLQEPDSTATKLMAEMCGKLDEIKDEVEAIVKSEANGIPEMDEYRLDGPAQEVLKGALNEAGGMGNDTVNTCHLLLALLKYDSRMGSILNRKGISYDAVHTRVEALREEETDDFDYEEDDEPQDRRESEGTVRIKKNSKDANATPFLDKFGNDLTKAASEGKLDPVVGREKEIERVEQILSRRKKSNPILIGEPGVGKTAIVEGLAERIARKEVPVTLMGRKIVALNLSMMVAGTKYRGEFEKRIQTMLDEIEAHREIIVFIDEIHTIVGAGSASGSLDAANILKPSLAKGKIQCIGSTTIDEYRKTIEKDGALERRFQKIMVEPTTPAETLEILKQIKGKYEEHHNVTYTDEALEACVRLTDRYISERQLPDKAIDALDEAGSRMHMRKVAVPQTLKDIENNIQEHSKQKMIAVGKQDFEYAAKLRNEELELRSRLEKEKTKWQASLNANRLIVEDHDIEETVSAMSGVPVQRMVKTESERLKGLEKNLRHDVIAQDRAIEKIVKAITRNRIGLRDPNKPIGTFMFLGPTGVGKTYLAKKLAEFMFGSSEALIRIDMSEYTESFSASRLVGAPPGYVGYEDGGQLTEKVRRHPYSIVLLDEIEKANKEIFNLLLQVMDEGRLTDSNGCTVDFRNTMLVITSNCGTRQVAEFGNGVGFRRVDESERARLSNDIIEKALRKQFAPEFLNRIDELVMFEPLDRDAIRRIADLELGELNKRLQALGYNFEIDDKGIDFLIDKGYSKEFGARQLRRTIQSYVEDGLSEYLLGENKKEGGTIAVTHAGDAEVLSFT